MPEKQNNNKLLQWHPAFYASMQIELAEDAPMLTFENEHHLSTKPIQIDVLIIKKQPDYKVKKNIGQIFRNHNIVEYKAPGDYISIEDYYKAFSYAYLYKASVKHTDEIPLNELTLTFVCPKYPRKLFTYLTTVRKLSINKINSGIYYIQNDTLPVQVLVSSKLSEDENIWLKSLTNNLSNKTTINKLATEYIHHRRDELYKSAMNIIVRANYEQFEEGQNMCEALLELWKDDIDAAKDEARIQGRLEGIQEGRQEGIQEGRLEGRLEGKLEGTISVFQSLGLSKEQAIIFITEKLGYNTEDSKQYVDNYWAE